MKELKNKIAPKKVKKATKQIIEVNYQIQQFCNGMLIKYDDVLEQTEKDSLKSIEQHMINLSGELSKSL